MSDSIVRNSTFSSASEKVLPSVIHIRAVDTKTQKTPEGWDFSYNPFTPAPGNIFEEKKEYFDEGLGSGVIIRQDGNRFYAVTNRHVIENADTITVKIFSGEFLEAKLAGYDERKDIAVIFFETSGTGIKVIKTGNSDLLKVGDWVLAVGSPFGFDSSVTAGIISALGRKNNTGGNISDFIQTDASINTGNSGGALVNMKGELIGINSWITTTTGGSMGLGFAIPVNNLIKSVDDIIRFGEVRYGWIGIIAGEIAEYEQETFNIKNKKGIMVFQVIENGPADNAGLIPGDFIMDIDGKKTENVDSLLLNVGDAGSDKISVFRIIRDGQENKIEVKLGLRENREALSEENNSYWPGISVLTINKKILNIKDSDKYDSGVIVSYIEKGGVLDFFTAGDVITGINGKTIKDSRDFYRELNSKEKNIAFQFFRDNVLYVKEITRRKIQ